jgi:hypothetical protein
MGISLIDSNNKLSSLKKSTIPNYSILRSDGSIEWAYIPDIELMKKIFEKKHPTKELRYRQGPCLYYYKVWIENKKIDEHKL